MESKQIQKAGDNAQQIQGETINIYNGITEQRAREIFDEMYEVARKENTIEAEKTATVRIKELEKVLIPKIENYDNAFECFLDPSFQVLLKKAQITAACTERELDYSILSELLLHRVKNKADIKKKASITKAVEIVDQIDDDSLCAITLYHSIRNFIPNSGRISEGIEVLSNLYKKIDIESLPKNEMWMDNLSILGAISIIPYSKPPKYEEILYESLGGYVCAGIQKDSEEYKNIIDVLNQNGINASVLVDNELLEGYVRLEINQREAIENYIINAYVLDNGQIKFISKQLSDNQKQCLYDVFDQYSKDPKVIGIVKNNFNSLLEADETIKIIKKWWNSLPTNIRLSSIGKVVAHTNVKRIDTLLPDLD